MSDMEVLTPQLAAGMANRVYDARTETSRDAADQFHDLPGNHFELQNIMQGVSGHSMINDTTGFGYIARSTLRLNEAVVVIRGTATGYDGWTDAVGAFARSPSGHAVHSGFNTCYRSFRQTLMSWFEGKPELKTVHCVGHSLGAALATLAADDLSSYGKRVALYTFGSPRVGTDFYASYMGKKLVGHNYRVHNRSDPVTMVGPWMYTHLRGADFTLPWSGGSIDFSAHKMGNYIKGVGESAWKNLTEASVHRARIAADVRALLDTPSTGDGITMYSTAALGMISKCLGWLLEQAATALGAAALVHLTLLDQLSYLVYSAGSLPMPSDAVVTVLGWIMKFLGRTAESVKDASLTFIRWCLGLFLNVISSMAQRAMYHARYFPQL